ncbi:hypothetical protein NDU88_006687 [Pleurodeles waltl]|uniref:Uncharacterized protein n=1 Tax=Pleurodeles waltl TaxID=8319 RepID=A0AAV7PRD8_PLEWA|nr:hypothetical protein NDU88_006687 [Pleurodeles waltl]
MRDLAPRWRRRRSVAGAGTEEPRSEGEARLRDIVERVDNQGGLSPLGGEGPRRLVRATALAALAAFAAPEAWWRERAPAVAELGLGAREPWWAASVRRVSRLGRPGRLRLSTGACWWRAASAVKIGEAALGAPRGARCRWSFWLAW